MSTTRPIDLTDEADQYLVVTPQGCVLERERDQRTLLQTALDICTGEIDGKFLGRVLRFNNSSFHCDDATPDMAAYVNRILTLDRNGEVHRDLRNWLQEHCGFEATNHLREVA